MKQQDPIGSIITQDDFSEEESIELGQVSQGPRDILSFSSPRDVRETASTDRRKVDSVDVIRVAKTFLSHGIVGKQLVANLRKQFSRTVLAKCQEQLTEVIDQHHGLLGTVYLDASLHYPDCQKSMTRLKKASANGQTIDAVLKTGGCTRCQHNSGPLCTSTGMKLLNSPDDIGSDTLKKLSSLGLVDQEEVRAAVASVIEVEGRRAVNAPRVLKEVFASRLVRQAEEREPSEAEHLVLQPSGDLPIDPEPDAPVEFDVEYEQPDKMADLMPEERETVDAVFDHLIPDGNLPIEDPAELPEYVEVMAAVQDGITENLEGVDDIPEETDLDVNMQLGGMDDVPDEWVGVEEEDDEMDFEFSRDSDLPVGDVLEEEEPIEVEMGKSKRTVYKGKRGFGQKV